MTYPTWCGVTTRAGVPRWQNLIICLILIAILSLTLQVATTVLLLSWYTSPILLGLGARKSLGVILASTTTVLISAIAILGTRKSRRFNMNMLAFVIVASRCTALISAANAVWLAICLPHLARFGLGASAQLGHFVQLANLSALFLTVSQAVLSLVLSCICLRWGNVRARQISRAVFCIISGCSLLPLIVYGGISISPKLIWPAFTLLAWSIYFLLFGVVNAVSVLSTPYREKLEGVVMTVLEAINFIFAFVLIMTTIGCFNFLNNPRSLKCTESLDFECSNLIAGFLGLYLFVLTEECLASILSLWATNYPRPEAECVGTNGADINTLARQLSLPPCYEELFPGTEPGTLEIIGSGGSGEGNLPEVKAPSLVRQETLPPQYEDVMHTDVSNENQSTNPGQDSTTS